MKIIQRNFRKGIVKLVPTNLDDLWHLYNIIYKGDLIYARTTREVKTTSEYSRPQKGKRVSTIISIQVENIMWDRSLNTLRLLGRIHEAPENIAGKGSHHTLKIKINRPLTIVKNQWLKSQMNRLENSQKNETTPIVVISIDSEEFAIALVRQYGFDLQVKGRAKLAGKLEAERRAESLKKYFNEVQTALSVVWREEYSSIVIIGVGYIKKQFLKFIKSKASIFSKYITEVKSVNNSGVAGIIEAVRSGILNKSLGHFRIVKEVKLVEEIFERLAKGTGNVTYGKKQIEKAEKYGAIDVLVITDFTIRDVSDDERLVLENLMRKVEEKNGRVVVISIEHEGGQKLHSLGGVAALLRFPINGIV